jgi:hypothetical protein
MLTRLPLGFGPTVLRGLADLGPVDPSSGDLSLELGLSAWMRTHTTSLEEARAVLLEIRLAIVDACDLDEATEPVPFVGRSPRLDVITLISCVSDLLRRGAAEAGCSVRSLALRVSTSLPEPEGEAVGA